MDPFSRYAIRVAVAQICQTVGWTSIHSSPLEILTDILEEYITGIAKLAARYALLFGQSEPNLHHVALSFRDMGISISELEEFVTYVESSSVLEVPKYPIPKESHLNHLKPGSREVVTRPVHIHEHLPPMHPHLEDEDYLTNKSPLTVEVSTSDSLSPLSSPKNIFKKPGDPISADPRRGRAYLDDEIRPLREISSVMMTTSGFLSPAREGKLPEARTQPIDFSNPSSPEPPSPQPEQQSQEQQAQQQFVDIKPEKKKKTKNVEVLIKKPDKENKSKDELPYEQKDTEDESKGKKLVTTKEISKLKPFKTCALKMQPKPPSSSPPPQKKAKLSPNSNQSITTKTSKVKSPKNDKIPLSPLVKDSIATSSPKDSVTAIDIKLPSEPDKQKLNIFKKITKMKDDQDDSKSVTADHIESYPSPVDSAFAPKRKAFGDSTIKDIYKLDAQIDIDNSPPKNLDEIPVSAGFEKPIEVHKMAEYKKKKKDKQKDKKDPQSDADYISKTKHQDDDSFVKGKSSVIDMTISQEDLSITPSSTSVPGIISTWSNPVYPPSIPPICISTTGSNLVTTKNQDISLTTGEPSTFSPPSSSSATHDLSVTPLTCYSEKESNLLIDKKKERKREKKIKDKIKKKKDKKDKNKIKDKSERKKLKLEKKEKAKLKLKKEKKEKKKEKEVLANRGFEQNHIAEDVLNTLTPWGSDIVPSKKLRIEEKDEILSQVPKITFKLGPASPKDNIESPCPRKIYCWWSSDSYTLFHILCVIKPIVKKEEDNHNTGNINIQDTKIQLTATKVKGHKSGKSSHQSKIDTPDKPPGFLFPQAVPYKQDSFPIVPKWETDPNQVWICPACGRQDDGSPMIACDMCDLWFHWTCVGIIEAIESDWYCKKCTSKKDEVQTEKKKKHRKKKN